MSIDEMIEVLTAAKAGKKIQYREKACGGEWEDTEVPTWNFYSNEYRVKPEPRRFWVTIGSCGKVITNTKPALILEEDELIEVVEVIK